MDILNACSNLVAQYHYSISFIFNTDCVTQYLGYMLVLVATIIALQVHGCSQHLLLEIPAQLTVKDCDFN